MPRLMNRAFRAAREDSEFYVVLALGWLLTGVNAAIALTYGATLAGILETAGTLIGWPITLALHRRGQRVLANYALLLGSVFYIFVGQNLIGPDADFDLLYLPIGVAPLLLFRSSQRRHMFTCVSFAVIGWLLGEFDFINAWCLPHRPAAIPGNAMHLANFGGAFVMVCAFVDTFARANQRLNVARAAEAARAHAGVTQAFDQLARSERSLSAVFDVMVDAIMIQDAAGNVIQMNEAARSQYAAGRAHFNLFDRDDWRARTPDGHDLTTEEMPSRVALRTGRAQLNIPMRVRMDDGLSAHVIVNAVPYRADGRVGPPTHVLVVMSDVTAQRKTERLLYQIVNSTPDWIFIKDRDHRYVTVNESFARALGRTPAELIGKNELDLGFTENDVHGDPSRGLRGFWRDDDLVFATNQLQTYDDDRVRLNGRDHWFHTHKAPLRDENADEPHAILCYSRDITHMKEIEEKLVQASRLASLGQMAGGIAHEINNPLAIIQGKAQLLAREFDAGRAAPAATRDALAKIIETTHRIAAIVRGLRTVSRAGDDDAFQVLSLAHLVHEAVGLARDKFKGSGVTLDAAVDARLKVMGSAAQLGQVLINLLNNAHDAVAGTANPWVKIEISADDDRARIAVIDGGPEIPEDVATKLMRPFFTTKSAGLGTGLGLVISQKIVSRHGGRLYLVRPATHTRFVVELPISDQEMNAHS